MLTFSAHSNNWASIQVVAIDTCTAYLHHICDINHAPIFYGSYISSTNAMLAIPDFTLVSVCIGIGNSIGSHPVTLTLLGIRKGMVSVL